MEGLSQQIHLAQKQGAEMIQAFMVQGATIQQRYMDILNPIQQQWQTIVSQVEQQALHDSSRLQAAASVWALGGKGPAGNSMG